MEIRTAVEVDIPRIVELYAQLFALSARMQPERFRGTPQDGAFLREVVAAGDQELFVADDAGNVCGFALVQDLATPPYDCVIPYRYAYLMDLCVDERHRNSGVGALLMESVKSWARARGLRYVELCALAQNEGAIRFYRRNGFADQRKILQFDL
ncbi:GNAT family N-acetyltransferase [uncultured Anaerotruncus sp.]|uniref:GNAT family N-acetyltransferase n=1 Tax=uncultured Anaerotruncus sp. TaxID=905011 RepID=UPI00280AD6E8|nr:GNAT family N-acetyltransferase [uncultured Anaerotruncus sp.]